jgi:uncharacterized protein (DUF2062 family)
MAPACNGNEPRICLVMPAFNAAPAIAHGVEEALRHVQDIIVVNDGCTDDTSARLAPFALGRIHVIVHAQNQGKGAALMSGFRYAAEKGFSHAITMDADGQHLASDLPAFLSEIKRSPHALLLGRRNLAEAETPLMSRIIRLHSNVWVWLETGKWVKDSPSGFRGYPLDQVLALPLKTRRYDFEIESLVKLAWRGTPIRTVPIHVGRDAGCASNFGPLKDTALIAHLNAELVLLRIFLPNPFSGPLDAEAPADLPLRKRCLRALRAVLRESAETPARASLSIGLGVMMGILPIWGFQMTAAVLAAHVLGLKKTYALLASNISFPAAIPLILYLSLLTGRFVLSGHVDFTLSAHELNLDAIWDCAREYVLGAIVFGMAAGAFSALSVYLLAEAIRKMRPAE